MQQCEFDSNCCKVSPDQPKGFHGSFCDELRLQGLQVFGDFNQTYVAGYGTPATADSAVMYVGAKGYSFGVFSAVEGVEDVSRYHYRSADGKVHRYVGNVFSWKHMFQSPFATKMILRTAKWAKQVHNTRIYLSIF